MKCGARVALGVAGGYFLGRTRKMKLALMFAGMAAGRRAGGPGELLRSGTSLLGSSPELARLTDEVRGRLVEAGRTAAVAVATRQVESLTDRIGRRVESLGEPGAPGRAERPDGEPGDEPSTDERPSDEPPTDEPPTDDETPAPPRRPTRAVDAAESGGPDGGAEPAPTRRTGGSAPADRTASRTAGKAATRTGTKAGAKAASRTPGKTTNGRRSPRTRRADGDG